MNRERSEKEDWQAGKQQTGEGHEVQCGQRLRQALVSTGESSEACGPGKGPFKNPATLPTKTMDRPTASRVRS
jgi:hypothetical protein